MSGESDEILPTVRYLECLARDEVVSLPDEYEALALIDAWNERHPESPAVATSLSGQRWVVARR